MSTTRTRATFHERIAMRRECILALLERRPGLTASEIGEDLHTIPWGSSYTDLLWLKARGKVQSIAVSPRCYLWHLTTPVEPLRWGGDDA